MEAWNLEMRILAFSLLMALLEREVQARMAAYCLSLCGVGWDEDYGGLRRMY
jgi:hypothetical protein